MLIPWLALCGACDAAGDHPSARGGGAPAGQPAAGTDTAPPGDDACTEGIAGGETDSEVTDDLDAGRLLRRTTLALLGRFPTDEEIAALAEVDAAEQTAWVEAQTDAYLGDLAFYEQMLEFGHEWIAMPMFPRYADFPEYSGHQANIVVPCGPDTANPGKWTGWMGDPDNCDGIRSDGGPEPQATVEPWWAEGTTIEVIGPAALDARVVDIDGAEVDCGRDTEDGCGCGPNMVYCYPTNSLNDAQTFVGFNANGQRRMLWEEPARLFAHLAWYDRPLSDLVTGDYSVGPTRLQSAYVRWGRSSGARELDDFQDWWRTSSWSAPTDPFHDADDPSGWSQFPIHTRNPYLVEARDVYFDPVLDAPDQLEGIPSAGVLTMLGMLGAFPRERVRAARMLEIFACENFVPPPPDIEFAPYHDDPATQGTCQTCHVRIDPAAIHFKRVQRLYSGRYPIVAVGANQFPPEWVTLTGNYKGEPWTRFARSFVPGTRLTPISAADAAADPHRLFVDYLPPDQTLFGQRSDGTVGPLGFGKLLVESGTFDRCVVKRLHERIVGRTIDETREAGYFDEMVKLFVEGDRKLRPFVRQLVSSESFRRGI